MGPSNGRKRRNLRKTTTTYRKKKKSEKETTAAAAEAVATTTTTTTTTEPVSPLKTIDGGLIVNSPCTTPKAKKYRIPEINTCPPAPKKRRNFSNSSFSLKRSPISFFVPPDLEHFFYVALQSDVSVPSK